MNKPVRVLHFDSDLGTQEAGRVVIEEVQLRIDILGGESFTIMRTPGADGDLVVGFLLSEGLIDGFGEIVSAAVCANNSDRWQVCLARMASNAARRNTVVNSACGLCGSRSVEEWRSILAAPRGELTADPETLLRLPVELRRRQVLFRATGGSHAAALFDASGELSFAREDVGRHNALDKVIGAALLAGETCEGRGAILSGRVSLEMIIKSARAGIALVAAISAPTSAAVELANALGITLCGFVRENDFCVYSHAERLLLGGRVG